MGRKLGLRVNPKKFAAEEQPCVKELMSFLSCMAMDRGDDKNCMKQKDLMMHCMDEQKKKPKSKWSTINYHLRRLSRK